jgi:hypothetical protein
VRTFENSWAVILRKGLSSYHTGCGYQKRDAFPARDFETFVFRTFVDIDTPQRRVGPIHATPSLFQTRKLDPELRDFLNISTLSPGINSFQLSNRDLKARWSGVRIVAL